MPTANLPIVKIGTLYYIPIDAPQVRVSLDDFSPERGHETGSEATIVDYSTQDRMSRSSDQDFIVAQVPFYNNGDTRTMDDVIDGELQRVYTYLHQKGLVPTTVLPQVILTQPFALALQHT